MKKGKKILTIFFAMFMLAVGFTYEASAQRRVVVRRPVIVRNYVYADPFWRARYYGYGSPYYNSFYYQSPYERYREQQYYLERDLAGNQRELAEHQRKYRADGVITAKERRELEDDIKDVRNSRARLRSFGRYY
jgi:hypothetical protein